MSRTYRKLAQPRKQDHKRHRLTRPKYREDGLLVNSVGHRMQRTERYNYRQAAQDVAGDAIDCNA